MKAVNFIILALAILFLYSCKDNNNPVTTTPNDKPVAALISPTSQTEIIDSVYVEISAKDNKGVTRVDFIVDNVVIKSWPVGPYKTVVDLSMYTDSSWHSAYAKVYDADSNFTTTPVITLTFRRLLSAENLWVEAYTDKIVKLHWTDKSKYATGYQVEKAEYGGTYNIIGTTGPNDSSFVVDNLDSSKEYTFRVKPIRGNYAGAYTTTNKVDYLKWWDQGPYFNQANYSTRCILYIKSSDLIITGTTGGTIQINNYNTCALIKTITAHSNYVYGLSLNPIGNTFASTGGDNTIKIWNSSNYSLVKSIATSDSYYSISYSPDGTMIAGISSYYVKIWNASTGAVIGTMNLSSYSGSSYSDVFFSKDGSLVIFSDGSNIKFYKVNGGTLLKTITGSSSIYSLASSQDGLTLAAGHSDNSIELYDAGSGLLENTLYGATNEVTTICFSDDNKLLLTGDYNGNMKLWDLDSSACIYSASSSGYYLSFGKDNNSIIMSSGYSTYILTKKTGWQTYSSYYITKKMGL